MKLLIIQICFGHYVLRLFWTKPVIPLVSLSFLHNFQGKSRFWVLVYKVLDSAQNLQDITKEQKATYALFALPPFKELGMLWPGYLDNSEIVVSIYVQ